MGCALCSANTYFYLVYTRFYWILLTYLSNLSELVNCPSFQWTILILYSSLRWLNFPEIDPDAFQNCQPHLSPLITLITPIFTSHYSNVEISPGISFCLSSSDPQIQLCHLKATEPLYTKSHSRMVGDPKRWVVVRFRKPFETFFWTFSSVIS